MDEDSAALLATLTCAMKKTYRTMQNADQALRIVRERFGKTQYRYRCDACGWWHLSTDERSTE